MSFKEKVVAWHEAHPKGGPLNLTYLRSPNWDLYPYLVEFQAIREAIPGATERMVEERRREKSSSDYPVLKRRLGL